jgi:putative ABC transport system ATP-binding protein
MTRVDPASNLLELKGICKSYGRGDRALVVLDDVNMDIARGSFIALMGPSGSGKSTMLNLMAGIDRPDRGQIVFAGQRIDTWSQSQLTRWRAGHVGFVFQNYNLLPMLNAVRNVEMPLLLTRSRRSERRDRVHAALELVGLSDSHHKLPSQMSGGQQQRVAIARAIVSNASLLLCDEPTGNLDAKSSVEILSTLRLLNDEFSKTIVLVTHDPRAAGYAQKIYALEKGQFAEMAAPA